MKNIFKENEQCPYDLELEMKIPIFDVNEYVLNCALYNKGCLLACDKNKVAFDLKHLDLLRHRVNVCSHSEAAAAIFLPQQKSCIGFNVSVHTAAAAALLHFLITNIFIK